MPGGEAEHGDVHVPWEGGAPTEGDGGPDVVLHVGGRLEPADRGVAEIFSTGLFVLCVCAFTAP